MRIGGVAIVLAITLALIGCARGDAGQPAAPVPTSEASVAPPPAEPPPADADADADADAPTRDGEVAADDADPDVDAPAIPPPELAPATDEGRDELVGLSTAQLVAKWGEPDQKRADRWTYRFPRHDDCVEQRTVMTLWLRGGKVIKAEQRKEMTGDHCARADF